MSDWAIVLGTLLYCIGSAVIPLMHAEAYLITLSAVTTSPALSWAIVLAATTGQMIGKVGMYWAGRGALRLPSERMRRRLAAVTARYEGHRGVGNGLIFLSASTGLPPFYATAVVAGMLRVPLPSLILFGFPGRFFRFSVAVFVPQLVKSWL